MAGLPEASDGAMQAGAPVGGGDPEHARDLGGVAGGGELEGGELAGAGGAGGPGGAGGRGAGGGGRAVGGRGGAAASSSTAARRASGSACSGAARRRRRSSSSAAWRAMPNSHWRGAPRRASNDPIRRYARSNVAATTSSAAPRSRSSVAA